jgi:exopolysaccharide biosynthesis protein
MLLKKGSIGAEVKELQRLLNLKGYNVTIDGDFGKHTEGWVKAFQLNNGLVADGIVGNKTWQALQPSQYKFLRMFNTDLHIYTTNANQKLTIDFGKSQRETLTEQVKTNQFKEYCAINGGFFNYDGSSNHLGSFGRDGIHWHDPDPTFIDYIIYNDGKTEVKKINGNAECVELQKGKVTYFGTSYALLIDDRINLINTELFSHSTGRNSRTMLGQKADGTFVLVVADKNWGTSAGLIAHEQALIMQELGCVNAVNMDGGGSSEMVVGSKIMNKPDDGKERRVGSAILVIDKEV